MVRPEPDGRALHWVVREALGRDDVPGWNDPARTTKCRCLFGAHVMRLLLATYLGGLRQRWEETRHLTADTL